MDHFRVKYARRETLTSDVAVNEMDGVAEEQLNLENAELVHFGLSRLGLMEREVLTLCFLDDLSIAEIAIVLEIPMGTVKSRLFKARHDLRRVLEAEAHRYEN
jgi:RNA polymerase sigma-70 factor (ECF subfamily)